MKKRNQNRKLLYQILCDSLQMDYVLVAVLSYTMLGVNCFYVDILLFEIIITDFTSINRYPFTTCTVMIQLITYLQNLVIFVVWLGCHQPRPEAIAILILGAKQQQGSS